MEEEMQGQGGDTQIVDAIIAAVQQLMQAAGPEWTLQFLQAGMEEAAGGGEEPGPETVSPGGPGAMPPMGNMDPMSRALMGKR